jgi:hypothetical protein
MEDSKVTKGRGEEKTVERQKKFPTPQEKRSCFFSAGKRAEQKDMIG